MPGDLPRDPSRTRRRFRPARSLESATSRAHPGDWLVNPLAPLLAVGIGLLTAACNQTREAAMAPPPRPVLVAEAHYAPREQARVLAGVVQARTPSDLPFRISRQMAPRLLA